jgi:4-amino-4-deoxy-L-arabinose transferase-like glycosyltransferase
MFLFALASLIVLICLPKYLKSTISLAELLRNKWLEKSSWQVAPAGILVLYMLTLATLALVYPPNNWDAMTYHLPRVMHWIQQQSVAHFPTSNLRQLYQPPLAEYFITHLHLHFSTDRFDQLLQFFCMIGSVFGVSLVTKLFGGTTLQQWLAGFFGFGLPMSLLQSITAQNDLVLTFLLVQLVLYLAHFHKDGQIHWLFLGSLSFGMALLTKGTGYLLGAPIFAIFILIYIKKNHQPGEAHKWIGLMVAFGIVVAINICFWWRNFQLFGTPIYSHGGRYVNESFSLSTLYSNFLRNISLHLFKEPGIPSLQSFYLSSITKMHTWFNLDVNSASTTWMGNDFEVNAINLSEDFAGNPLQALFILFALLFSLGRLISNQIDSKILWSWAVWLCLGAIFCLYLKWQPFHSRLHLPLFYLAAPLFSLTFNWSKIAGVVCLWILLLPCYLWVTRSNNHPLFASPSIFEGQRNAWYFMANQDLYTPYLRAVHSLDSAKNIGLVTQEDDFEYPIWIFMAEAYPQKPTISHYAPKNPSLKIKSLYPSPDYLIVTNNANKKLNIISLKNK